MDQHHMQQQRGRRTSEQPVVRITDEDDYLHFDDDYDDEWPPLTRRYQGLADVKSEVGRRRDDVQPLSRHSGSGVDYRANIPARRGATQTSIPVVQAGRQRAVRTDEVPRGGGGLLPGFRPHWLFYVGVALLVMLLGWVGLTAFLGWWQVTQDDWHYGRPRTFQTDAVVGHNDSALSPSHFMAINLNRRIEIIEFPGGDPSKAKIYMGPILIGQNQDLTVVTLTFKDVNGDGKPDMIVNVQGSRFVFINENGGFRAARPNENVNLGT